MNGAPADLKLALHRLQNTIGHMFDVGNRQDVLHQDGKLVAAQPGRRILRAKRRAQPLGNRDQQRIARRVAQRVVDLLEAVQIQKEHAAILAAAARPAGKRLAQAVQKERAIGQSRQRVVQRIVLQLGFHPLALANIAKGR